MTVGLLTDAITCLLIALVLTVVFQPLFDVPMSGVVGLFVSNATISLGIGMSCATSYRWLFPALVARWPGRLSQAAFHALVVLSSAAVGTELAVQILERAYWTGVTAQRLQIFQIGATVCAIVVIVSLAYEGLEARARALELDVERSRKQALSARLSALQARTDPHFLFNSLNAVAGLIRDEPEKAERMLELLSSLFRYSLDGARSEWVALEQEIAAVRDYLEAEGIRFGERLRAEVLVEPGLERYEIPPLALQPLVENAVKHAVASRVEGGRIEVRAERRAGGVLLRVEDDGPGEGGSTHRGSGTSLDDLEQRLELAYDGGARVEHGDREGGGFSVRLELPDERRG